MRGALLRPPTGAPVLRSLGRITLVNSLGNGLFRAVGALYFTRVAGIGVEHLALGLAVGAGCGLLGGPLLGSVADRVGYRRLLCGLLCLQAVAVLAYTQVSGVGQFLPVAAVAGLLDGGAGAVRKALIGVALPAAIRVPGRAYLRAVGNAGLGLGAAGAAVALHLDSRAGYLAVLSVDAGTFLLAAGLLLRLADDPAMRRAPRGADGGGRPRTPDAARRLVDLRYLAVTAVSGVLALQAGILEFGLPLWVVGSTGAPRVVVSVALVLNTVMVVLLQVRFSRGTEDPRGATTACRRAGLLLLVACALYAAAAGLPSAAAAAVLLAAVVITTVAEMRTAAGATALSYELADPGRHGLYQGVFSSCFAAGAMLGPVVVAHTALRFGTPGWLMLGGVLLVSGGVLGPVTRWVPRGAGGPPPAPLGATTADR